MSSIPEYSFGIAGVFNFRGWSPVLKLFLQPNERICAESSSAPRLFHLWRVVNEVYPRIRAFQQKVMPAPFPNSSSPCAVHPRAELRGTQASSADHRSRCIAFKTVS